MKLQNRRKLRFYIFFRKNKTYIYLFIFFSCFFIFVTVPIILTLLGMSLKYYIILLNFFSKLSFQFINKYFFYSNTLFMLILSPLVLSFFLLIFHYMKIFQKEEFFLFLKKFLIFFSIIYLTIFFFLTIDFMVVRENAFILVQLDEITNEQNLINELIKTLKKLIK